MKLKLVRHLWGVDGSRGYEQYLPRWREVGYEAIEFSIRFVTDRPGHDYRYAIDPSRIERDLAWRAAESFESGLRKTVEWYLANESWWRPLRGGAYRGERLGLGQRT